jgi:hypothetical protein
MAYSVHWGFEWRWICDWGEIRGAVTARQVLLELV